MADKKAIEPGPAPLDEAALDQAAGGVIAIKPGAASTLQAAPATPAAKKGHEGDKGWIEINSTQ